MFLGPVPPLLQTNLFRSLRGPSSCVRASFRVGEGTEGRGIILVSFHCLLLFNKHTVAYKFPLRSADFLHAILHAVHISHTTHSSLESGTKRDNSDQYRCDYLAKSRHPPTHHITPPFLTTCSSSPFVMLYVLLSRISSYSRSTLRNSISDWSHFIDSCNPPLFGLFISGSSFLSDGQRCTIP